MFQTNVVEKSISFPKIVHFTRYVIKYVTAGQAIDDNIIRRTHLTHWITKATHTLTHTHTTHTCNTHTHTQTHTEYVILLAFPRQQWSRERTSMLRLYAHCYFPTVSHNTMAVAQSCAVEAMVTPLNLNS